ncbi:MAG TPA: RodZ domain-containing protein [Thermomicrobiaceae bacterium]|nr:RodZ domain-containing protein [Thermomicrobiaceae bacterium]
MAEFGELLRHARAYKGVSLREAERATKINRHHLASLEREEFSELPPLIYARGIVRNYAQYLGLDPVAVLALFEEVHGQRSGGFRVVPATKPLSIPSHWAPNFAIIAFMVVMTAVIFAWLYSAYFAPSSATPTPTTTAALVTSTPGSTSVLAGTPTAQALQVGALGTPTPLATPTTAPTPSPTAVPTVTPTAVATVHQFAISTQQTVWVDVTVDGKLVWSGDIAPGTTKTFQGKLMHVGSGNSPYVDVSVDGVYQGAVGSTWNASKNYP